MAAPAGKFVAAVAQMCSTRDPLRNRDDAVALVREAARAGAAYVQTPEMTSLVATKRAEVFEKTVEPERDPVLAGLREAARETGIVVHAGSLIVRHGDKVANRAFLIDGAGEIVATYDKIHLFDVDLPNGESWRESSTYTGGTEAVIAETALGPIGLSICYDVRFAALYRAMAEAGAGMLTAPACFTRQTGEAHWHVLQRARAIETGSFVISAAQSGTHEDGRETFGHSLIVDPWGRVLADAGTGTGLALAEIDLALVAEVRNRIPVLKNGQPFAVRHHGATPRKLDAAE